MYQRSQVGLLAAQQQQRGNGEMSVGLDGKGYTNTGGSAQGYGHEQGHGHDLLLDVPEGKASFTPYVIPTSASTGATRNSFTSQPSRRILPSSLTGSADIHPSTSQMYPTYAVNPQAHTAYIPMSTIIFTLINLKQFSVKASEGGRIDGKYKYKSKVKSSHGYKADARY